MYSTRELNILIHANKVDMKDLAEALGLSLSSVYGTLRKEYIRSTTFNRYRNAILEIIGPEGKNITLTDEGNLYHTDLNNESMKKEDVFFEMYRKITVYEKALTEMGVNPIKLYNDSR